MKFDGYDFIIVGLILGVGGALLFGKAYLMPSYPMESAATYLGANPFQVRNTIIARHEAIAGAVWLVAGLLLSLLGTVRSVRAGRTGYLIEFWFDIIVLLAAGLVLWRLTIVVTDRTSRTDYLPKIVEMSWDAYARDIFVIFHEGLYREESARGVKPSEDAVRRRWEAAAETFNRLAKLLDEPRPEGEDYQAYALRLQRHFPGVSKE